ncbi:hypothetical protein [Lunatimonas lonarensis]|nr:hypothetical protein [Lunatimonas lonarensis]
MLHRICLSLVLLWGSFALSSCEETIDVVPTTTYQLEIEELTEIIAMELFREITTQSAGTDSYGLRTVYDGDNDSNQMSITGSPSGRLVACILQQTPSIDQRRQISHLMQELTDCRSEAVKTFRTEREALFQRLEQQRQQVLEAAQSGQLSREEYNRRILHLRQRFGILMEELGDRHLLAVRPCVRTMVSGLPQVLGSANWENFYLCMSE